MECCLSWDESDEAGRTCSAPDNTRGSNPCIRHVHDSEACDRGAALLSFFSNGGEKHSHLLLCAGSLCGSLVRLMEGL